MSKRISKEFQLEGKITALYKDLDSLLCRNWERLRAEVDQFETTAAQSHVRYAGKSLLITFYPFILSEAQALHISQMVEAMIRLMEKTTRLFLQEPAIRHAFGFKPEQVELIEVDPGYEPSIPCARFDSFFDGRNLRFTELNTDGTSGMDGAEKVAKLFVTSPTMREFFSSRPIKVFDINQSVLQTLVDCNRQFAGGNPAESPRIAIVDWKGVATSAEFEAFAEFCKERGYDAVVADPRELEYDGRVLSHGGLKIDIIYRRVVSHEYVERLKEVGAMTRAFKDHNVCVVGSFRSDVAFNKKTFGVLQNPEFSRFFTEEERELVSKHVPWTHALEDVEGDYHGERGNVLDLVREHKDELVLKPSDLYGGKGVYFGIQADSDEWERMVQNELGKDYIVQEFITIPSMPIGVWNKELRMETRLIHLGEYVFGGKFCGFYCRAADRPVLNRVSRELLVPCLVLKN